MTEGWVVAGCSVRGRSHERAGTSCQDASGWRELSPTSLVVAIADGAGSARFSETGAKAAVARVLDHVAESAGPSEAAESLLADAAASALVALHDEARKLETEIGQLACTLLIVHATPRGTSFYQIGDGAIVMSRDGAVHALTRPAFGEHINETVFLTSKGALEGAQRGRVTGPPSPVALLTDGLEMLALAMPSGEPHAKFFAPLFNLVATTASAPATEEIRQLLESPKVKDRADDDLTLVVAHAPSLRPAEAPSTASSGTAPEGGERSPTTSSARSPAPGGESASSTPTEAPGSAKSKAPARPKVGAPAGRPRDRGALLLVGAVALAVTALGILAILLLAPWSGDTDPAADRASSSDAAVERLPKVVPSPHRVDPDTSKKWQ